ncbi:hypothetical protein ACFLYQ_03745 [Chloroflexota bacterium]
MRRKVLGAVNLFFGILLVSLSIYSLAHNLLINEPDSLELAFTLYLPMVLVGILDLLVGILTLKGRRLRWAIISLIVTTIGTCWGVFVVGVMILVRMINP